MTAATIRQVRDAHAVYRAAVDATATGDHRRATRLEHLGDWLAARLLTRPPAVAPLPPPPTGASTPATPLERPGLPGLVAWERRGDWQRRDALWHVALWEAAALEWSRDGCATGVAIARASAATTAAHAVRRAA